MTMTTEQKIANHKILFIGAGSMAEALIRGLVTTSLIRPESIYAFNRSDLNRLKDLQNRYHILIPVTESDEERTRLVREADIIVLAMKPKDVGGALSEYRETIHVNTLIISVVAGLAIDTIEQLLGRPQAIARTMPNTSATIGLGATGLAFSLSVNKSQRDIALAIFKSVGLAITIEEHMLNVITGLSGSGPAYIYYIMEAMIAAGMQGGLNEADSRALVLQTVLGAARMVEQTGDAPDILRSRVTSPNGTTFAAIRVLENHSFHQAIFQAIARATERAAEMGAEIAASLAEPEQNNNETA
jgi:pyrroline-5-carboxylate reductase